MKRFGILLFAAVLALGMLFPQTTFATGKHHDKWDFFCKPDKWPEKPFKKWYGGDCEEIFVKVKLPKIWKEIAGKIQVEVYWSETGKLKDAQLVKSGKLELDTEKAAQFTHEPEKSGYYWFKLSKKGKHKALWTGAIQVDCPDKPGGDQPAEPPQDGGDDEQPGGNKPGDQDQNKPDDQNKPVDQTKPDDGDASKEEGKSGEIPNNKGGQGGGKLPKTATSHPQTMLIGGLLLLAGAGILALRRRVA